MRNEWVTTYNMPQSLRHQPESSNNTLKEGVLRTLQRVPVSALEFRVRTNLYASSIVTEIKKYVIYALP